jgi:outer membrane protein assembly factor BamB
MGVVPSVVRGARIMEPMHSQRSEQDGRALARGWSAAAVGVAMAVASAAAIGADADSKAEEYWPKWRGPLMNGVAPKADPPAAWSEDSNVRWKFSIPGFGASTPIVWENQVFLLTAVKKEQPEGAAAPAPAPAGNEPANRPQRGGRRNSQTPTEPYQFMILSVDRQTGGELWRATLREEIPHEGHHQDHGYASSSPVTDGENLYVNYGSRGLYCLGLDGKVKWEKDLGDMRTRNGFGEGTSPALHGNVLVVNWDHEGDDFIVALDKRDGRELWRRDRNEPTTWTTPLVIEHEGKTHVVVSGTERIRAYDLQTGEELWQCGGMTVNVIPTPVHGFGMVYPISGFNGAALLAIKVGHNGDLTDTDAIAWKHNRNTPYVPSPLLYGERLYFCRGNNAILSTLNAKTGEVLVDAERIPGMFGVYASPLGARGRVYLVGRDGKSVVFKDGDKLEILATNELDDRFDASPAAVGKQLFLRGHKSLYCIEEG